MANVFPAVPYKLGWEWFHIMLASGIETIFRLSRMWDTPSTTSHPMTAPLVTRHLSYCNGRDASVLKYWNSCEILHQRSRENPTVSKTTIFKSSYQFKNISLEIPHLQNLKLIFNSTHRRHEVIIKVFLWKAWKPVHIALARHRFENIYLIWYSKYILIWDYNVMAELMKTV